MLRSLFIATLILLGAGSVALAQTGGGGGVGPAGGEGGFVRPPLEATLSDSALAQLDPAARNYAAVPLVRDAGRETDWCYKNHLTESNLGDVSNTKLMRLRQCIANAMAELIDKMIALKSLQHSARFDYALFSETARLLTVASNPGREALDPFVAMLREAEAAAQDESEKILLAEMSAYGEKVRGAVAEA